MVGLSLEESLRVYQVWKQREENKRGHREITSLNLSKKSQMSCGDGAESEEMHGG